MSNTKPPAAKSGNQIVVPPHANNPWSRAIRETVESIVIAFVLAFLFRTFEAEAFVIPTGSMAPTLQGRHKDIQCPQCGYSYRVSASSEVDNRTGARIAGCDVDEATCPMCGYKLKIDRNDPKLRAEYPSYNGDRIIVNKFAYDLSDPKRFDVVVFKYPEDSQVNYIKRLVGLPNEQFRIVHGDIYTAPLDSHDFTRDAKIARKSPEKLRAMLQPVYDNDYAVPKMIESGTKPRWQPWVAPGQTSPWTTSADYKSFTAENSPPQMSWIRYQNIDPATGNATVVEDKYAYNDGDTTGCPQRSYEVDRHWVGDLALDVQLTVKEPRGSVILELVKGGHQFRCQIDLAPGENQGRAEFSISGVPDFKHSVQTAIRGPGTYEVSFANVDEQLLLWVNGTVTTFDIDPPLQLGKPVERPVTPGSAEASDLSPAGIAVVGGAQVQVSGLKLWRDILYRADTNDAPNDPRLLKFAQQGEGDMSNVIRLEPDQFFMMGDNSPASADSRYFGKVDRRLLIGKALYIYWPHPWWPDWAVALHLAGTDINVPFWPNFKRMKFVH
jgi:signal peptidase I